MLPLSGLKVLDMTRVLSGPFCTMILADFGAEVIKVEAPETGDDSRAFGPFVNGESAYFMSINRNKQSITINTRVPEGVELVKTLVKEVDVIVENFKPGTMEKLGLGYEDLKKIKPDLIYTCVSGFGHSGPYSSRPAYDAIVQAAGGIMSITGPDENHPTRVGASVGDIVAGLYAAIGTLIAVVEKQKTGKGQKVDIAMLDCQVSILENAIARYFVNNEVPKPGGNKHPSIVPFEDFMCKDGVKVMIAVGNNSLWSKFCKAAKIEDLIEDERFKTNALRKDNYAIIKPMLDELFMTQDAQYWYDILVAANVPVTFVNTIDKLVVNEQVLAREMIVEASTPKVPSFKMSDTPIKLSETKGGFRDPAPTLGQDNYEVMEKFGFDKDKVAQMLEKGIM